MLAGDEYSLSILLSQYHSYLVAVGLRYLSDRQRVEDVIHDLFADLWNCNRKVDLTSSVKSFLRGGVVNKCLQSIRKDHRIELVETHSHTLVSSDASADQLVDLDNLTAHIETIVSTLPDKCQQVFRLSKQEGKSHQEISDQLSISKKTIENHMTKALRTLRLELKKRELLVFIFTITKTTQILGGPWL